MYHHKHAPQVFSRTTKGFVHALSPTPELWSHVVPNRTQIVQVNHSLYFTITVVSVIPNQRNCNPVGTRTFSTSHNGRWIVIYYFGVKLSVVRVNRINAFLALESERQTANFHFLAWHVQNRVRIFSAPSCICQVDDLGLCSYTTALVAPCLSVIMYKRGGIIKYVSGI